MNRLFRAVAIAEALSWAGLLVGMYLKWVVVSTEIGVKIFGPIHGIIVIAYLLTVLYVRSRLSWNVWTFLLAVMASVPPFATILFGVWADRRGLLERAEARAEDVVAVAR